MSALALQKLLNFFGTSHLDTHTTTDCKPEMLSGVQTGNGIPHYKYNGNRKDDIFNKRQLVQSFTNILEGGTRELCNGVAHSALDIIRFAVLFFKHFNFFIMASGFIGV